MARLLENTEKSIIQSNIKQHLNNTYSQFNKRLQGTPIYVTYYNQNKLLSTQDQTLNNIQEVLGANSPLRFNQINDLPLYMVSDITPQTEYNDNFGLTTNGEGEGVLLPNTVKPFVDDFMYVEMATQKLLFRVTGVEIDKFNGQKFYKIQFNISPYEKDLITEQVEEEYETHQENISSQEKAIIIKSDSLLIDSLNILADKLIKRYFEMFLDKKLSTINYQYNDKILYNEFLIKFIRDNDVLKYSTKKLLGSVYIQDIYPDTSSTIELYETTIYHAIVEDSLSDFKCENFITMEILKENKDNPFSFDPREFYRCFYVDNNSHAKLLKELDQNYDKYREEVMKKMTYDAFDFGKLNSIYWQHMPEPDPESKHRHVLIEPHSSLMIQNCNSNVLYDNNGEFFLENLLIQYFNKTLVIDDDFSTMMTKKNFHPTYKEFLLMPCIIFIIKRKVKELLSK